MKDSQAKSICEKVTKAISFEEGTDAGFKEWLKEADILVKRKTSGGIYDLYDSGYFEYDWKAAYDKGLKPVIAVNQATKEQNIHRFSDADKKDWRPKEPFHFDISKQ